MPSTPTIIAAFAFAIVLIGALIFWPAGTFNWPAGWFYVALVFSNFVANMLYLKRVNPELIEALLEAVSDVPVSDVSDVSEVSDGSLAASC